ncbi:asparaginase [Naumannella sp. ID2617S]|uniref:Asparaginase n=1 Tax=Enemella dayhoffiae TaxID=2016507 RepID=A0A255H6A0_9ACTN|nr:asparaginase [Enemella dayhoffiae]NNG20745.1 asparaginase [Naumannella sp. ID2617S]OYO22826.1 asparaginase [Enemella dayhoffiae]
MNPVALEVVRGGLVESVHTARVVVTDPDGRVRLALGAVDAPMYPRSAAKPMQAIGMLEAGLDLDGELLALAAASHSGEDFHLAGVRRILAEAGIPEDGLDCTADLPLDEQARAEWLRAGRGAEPVAMNCSGKHAAMLRTSVRNGWPTSGYRDPGHPVQRAVAAAIARLTGDRLPPATVDGCGAPLYAISLAGLARAFGRIAAAGSGPERLVADAFRNHPAYASGSRRDEAALHGAVPGIVTKAGAEAVQAAGLPDGTGIALKIEDGTPRGRAALMASVLRWLGYAHPVLVEQLTVPVLGHGRPVGEIRVRAGFFESQD